MTANTQFNFDFSQLPTDVAATRPATQIAWKAYVSAYDHVATLEDSTALMSGVKVLHFIENPLHLLDLLGSDSSHRLVRDTVFHSEDGNPPYQKVEIYLLELDGDDWSYLRVVGPEAVTLIESKLYQTCGSSTPYGTVERFTL